MVSKNNIQHKMEDDAKRVLHYGLRKLGIGVASVLLGTTLYFGNAQAVRADATNNVGTSETETEKQTTTPNMSNGTKVTLSDDSKVTNASNETSELNNGNTDQSDITTTKSNNESTQNSIGKVQDNGQKSANSITQTIDTDNVNNASQAILYSKLSVNNTTGHNVTTEVTSDTTDQTVNVSYTANSQTAHINYIDIDDDGKIVHTSTITGKTGDTVNLNLTVPDKYQLANGQQLPTTYTFTAGSGDVTIHLVHKVVQREATVDVKLVMITGVTIKGADYTMGVIPQTYWRQLVDKYGDRIKTASVGPDFFLETWPSVEVGTLTGHVNYDLVDNKVVSFGDDWTTLNLGGRTYQLPNGTDVVNGMINDSEDDWGKSFRESFLADDPNVDPDYATRPWHGYLSVNATNGSDFLAQENFLGLQGGLAGNESNALAKVNGDQAATAVEIANKTIDVSLLNHFDASPLDFSEQDGRLQRILPVLVAGAYIPYVEKIATRTINVTTPDGKTKTVKQTATLAKPVDPREDAHADWTTGEWTSYDVPTIPGYTASQPNVAKETVTGATKDQTVNITYTANPQTATVVYQTEDGTPVHTTMVKGQTGQTVKVSNEVPAGWMITKGQVPSEITFGPDGTPQTVVTIAHQHVTVDPDHPQNNGTTLPDNPAKTFSGVEVNDLNKTITRTIKVTTPDGQIKTVVQTAKLTRTADVDEVTGEATYGKWTTAKWSNYDVPTVSGYTASQNEVPAVEVTSDMTDQTVDISYTANSQTIHINYVDSAGKIVHTTTITGKTGDTVNLNLTVPDKYQLADGQQLPTTYTFTAGSGDVTIRLAHKVVQREATVDVQIGLMTLVDLDDESEPGIVVTQNQWRQLDDEIKKHALVNDLEEVDPTVEVGTLTGHVNYDLVDEKVVSFADDWTSLNLGGQTYQMPDGTDVVNGIIVGTDLSWGEKLKEHFLKYYPDDPDYVNRAWYGNLSVNKSNIDPDYAGFRLVGNESNALAKAIDDRAATAIEMTNKPIDLSSLREPIMGGGLSDFNEQDGQLRAKAIVPVGGMYIPYVEKTVTRTINVTTPDGKTTSVKQITTLAKQVTAQEDVHPDWTTGEWVSYDVPVISGYTASQSNVAKEAVTGATKDQTVNITYMANKQSTMIKYVDSKGQVVHTTTVDGVTAQNVKVPNEVPAGWTIVKGEVPSEITFGADGHEPIEVTIDHCHITVTPDQPQNNGTKLPDNPAKTFSGVEENDLNKTITRTIKVTTPDGQTKTVAQTAKLTRTADVDEVTGDVKYGEWSTGKWSVYNVPAVPGYTASRASVAATPVDENMKDQTVNISYTANSQTTHINYVDDAGKTVHTTIVTGKTGETVKVPNEVSAGWMITKGEVPSEISFGPNGHADETITIAHQHVTVDPDHPQNNGTKLPDNPAKTFEGVEANDLNKTITRTIKVTMPDGKTTTTKQIAKLARNADVDEVTGEVTYGNWTTGEWAAYDVPSVAGYTPSQTVVSKESVTATSKDTTVEITYLPMQHQISVEYVDDDDHGKIVKTDQMPGKTDQTITVTPSAPVNYYLVDNDNRTYTVTSDDAQAVQIHVKHHQVTTSETKTVTRTINVHTPHDGTKVVKQNAELTRKVTTDQVNGEKTYGDWTTGQWEEYTPEAIPGYTSSTNEVPNDNVDGNSKNQMVDVTYTADTQKVEIIYVDDTKGGAVVKTDQVAGKTDETFKVTPDVPAGYELVGKVPGDYTMTADGHQTITVHLVHQMKTASESKTVIRTINVYTPHDGTKVVKQNAELTRDVTTDQVTGEKTYGDWSATEWDRYAVPAVAGYVPSIEQVAQQVVNGTTTDQTIDVTYSSGEHTTHINYVDGDGNIVHTTTIKGQTDGTAQVPNETPAGWMVIGEPVPTELAFGPDGHADVTVTVAHQHVTVTPDQPKTPTDKLPDNPAKTYPNGVGHDDLNKTITRTIKVTTPDGQTKTVEQTAKLTRTADVDEVTGEVTYGKWTTGEWSNYDVPTVPGYTPSQSEVPAQTVSFGDSDIVKTVTYKANGQKLKVAFIDDTTGKTLNTIEKTGLSDTDSGYNTKADISDYAAKHYDLVSDGTNGQNLVFDHDDSKDQHYEVHLTHHKSDTSRQSIVNETVHYVYENSKQAADDYAAKPIVFTQTGVKDLVTGDTDWNGQWTSDQEFKAVDSPEITGYTPSQKTVDAIKVSHDTSDIKLVVTYVANNQVAKITYIDDVTGKVLATDEVSGKFGSRVDYNALARINSFEKQGYQLKTNGFDQPSYQADDTKNQFEIRLIHQLNKTSRESTVTRTISYVDSITGLTLHQPIIQTLKFIEDGVTDLVTNETTWQTASRQQFVSVKVPEIKGYASELSVVEPAEVGFGDANIETTVKYKKLDVTNTISYVDSQGKVIKTDTVSGQSGTEIKLDVPSGYHLVDNQTKVTISENNSTQTVKITKDNSANKIARHLPQTGNQRETGLVALGFAAGLLGLVVLRKKRN